MLGQFQSILWTVSYSKTPPINKLMYYLSPIFCLLSVTQDYEHTYVNCSSTRIGRDLMTAHHRVIAGYIVSKLAQTHANQIILGEIGENNLGDVCFSLLFIVFFFLIFY